MYLGVEFHFQPLFIVILGSYTTSKPISDWEEQEENRCCLPAEFPKSRGVTALGESPGDKIHPRLDVAQFSF